MLAHIKDKNLKSKLNRTDELTLSKVSEVVSPYHHEDALILVPEEQVNRVEATKKPVHHSMIFQDPMLQVVQRGSGWG